MRRGQKTGAEQVVLKLRQIEVRTAISLGASMLFLQQARAQLSGHELSSA